MNMPAVAVAVVAMKKRFLLVVSSSGLGVTMGTEWEERQLMQLQIDALSRAVMHLSSELVRVGMAGVHPSHSEAITVGAWGIKLLTDGLGYDLASIKSWDGE